MNETFRGAVEVFNPACHVRHNGVLSPVLQICAKTPFKNYSKAMFTLDEYMENSVNVTQSLLLDYSLLKFQGDEKPTPLVSCHKIFNTLKYF